MISVIGTDVAHAVITSGDNNNAVENTLSFIPFHLGRVIESKTFENSRYTVINIQDLHCHAEVHKNIEQIIGNLQKSYEISAIFVEGGYDKVDTGIFGRVKDEKLRNNIIEGLFEKGRLTGAEYYYLKNDVKTPFYGLEDKEIHHQNLERLSKALDNNERYQEKLSEIKSEIEYLKAKYFSRENHKFTATFENYRQGKMPAERYYALLRKYIEKLDNNDAKYNSLLPISSEKYPIFTAYCELIKTSRKIDYKKASYEMQVLVNYLKDNLSYNEYSKLSLATAGFSNVEELGLRMPELAKKHGINIDAGSSLGHLISYIEASRKINIVAMLDEERRIAEDIRIAFSSTPEEIEISFLSDFYAYLESFFNTKITAADYEFFEKEYPRFEKIYSKYAFKNTLSSMSEDIKFLMEYYKINKDRNAIFVKNIEKRLDKNAKNEIVIAVTGGFHSEGLNKIFNKTGVSYISIMPSVTQETKTAEENYNSFLSMINRGGGVLFSSQTLALALASQAPPAEIARMMIDAAVTSLSSLEYNEQNISFISKGISEALGKEIESDYSGDRTSVTLTLSNEFKITLKKNKSGNVEVLTENVGKSVEPNKINFPSAAAVSAGAAANAALLYDFIFNPRVYKIVKNVMEFAAKNNMVTGDGLIFDIETNFPSSEPIDGVEQELISRMSDEYIHIQNALLEAHKTNKLIDSEDGVTGAARIFWASYSALGYDEAALAKILLKKRERREKREKLKASEVKDENGLALAKNLKAKGIAAFDISHIAYNAQEAIEAVRQGKMLSLTFKLLENESLNKNHYERIYVDLSSFSTKFAEWLYPEHIDSKLRNDYESSIREVLKNTFAYGNRFKRDAPIYLFVDIANNNKTAVVNKVQEGELNRRSEEAVFASQAYLLNSEIEASKIKISLSNNEYNESSFEFQDGNKFAVADFVPKIRNSSPEEIEDMNDLALSLKAETADNAEKPADDALKGKMPENSVSLVNFGRTIKVLEFQNDNSQSKKWLSKRFSRYKELMSSNRAAMSAYIRGDMEGALNHLKKMIENGLEAIDLQASQKAMESYKKIQADWKSNKNIEKRTIPNKLDEKRLDEIDDIHTLINAVHQTGIRKFKNLKTMPGKFDEKIDYIYICPGAGEVQVVNCSEEKMSPKAEEFISSLTSLGSIKRFNTLYVLGNTIICSVEIGDRHSADIVIDLDSEDEAIIANFYDPSYERGIRTLTLSMIFKDNGFNISDYSAPGGFQVRYNVKSAQNAASECAEKFFLFTRVMDITEETALLREMPKDQSAARKEAHHIIKTQHFQDDRIYELLSDSTKEYIEKMKSSPQLTQIDAQIQAGREFYEPTYEKLKIPEDMRAPEEIDRYIAEGRAYADYKLNGDYNSYVKFTEVFDGENKKLPRSLILQGHAIDNLPYEHLFFRTENVIGNTEIKSGWLKLQNGDMLSVKAMTKRGERKIEAAYAEIVTSNGARRDIEYAELKELLEKEGYSISEKMSKGYKLNSELNAQAAGIIEEMNKEAQTDDNDKPMIFKGRVFAKGENKRAQATYDIEKSKGKILVREEFTPDDAVREDSEGVIAMRGSEVMHSAIALNEKKKAGIIMSGKWENGMLALSYVKTGKKIKLSNGYEVIAAQEEKVIIKEVQEIEIDGETGEIVIGKREQKTQITDEKYIEERLREIENENNPLKKYTLALNLRERGITNSEIDAALQKAEAAVRELGEIRIAEIRGLIEKIEKKKFTEKDIESGLKIIKEAKYWENYYGNEELGKAAEELFNEINTQQKQLSPKTGIIAIKELRAKDAPEYGEKNIGAGFLLRTAANLQKTLKKKGFKVEISAPDGIALGFGIFKEFAGSEFEQFMEAIKKKDAVAVKTAGTRIQELIGKADNESLKSSIIKTLSESQNLLAVRSSGIGEDGAENSYAGMGASYLNVNKDEVVENVLKVWESFFSAKIIGYAIDRGISAVMPAVLVQNMADEVDKSGATINGVTGAVFGLGEGLVSGRFPSDKAQVIGGKIEYVKAHGRSGKITPYEKGGTKEESLPKRELGARVLSETEAVILNEIYSELEKETGYPVDIEWAISSDNTIHILQIRPVTGFVKKGHRINYGSPLQDETITPASPIDIISAFIAGAYKCKLQVNSYTSQLMSKHIWKKSESGKLLPSSRSEISEKPGIYKILKRVIAISDAEGQIVAGRVIYGGKHRTIAALSEYIGKNVNIFIEGITRKIIKISEESGKIIWKESSEKIRIYRLGENNTIADVKEYTASKGRLPSKAKKVKDEAINMLNSREGIYKISGLTVVSIGDGAAAVEYDDIRRESGKLKPFLGQRVEVLIEVSRKENGDIAKSVIRIAENNVEDENSQAIWDLKSDNIVQSEAKEKSPAVWKLESRGILSPSSEKEIENQGIYKVSDIKVGEGGVISFANMRIITNLSHYAGKPAEILIEVGKDGTKKITRAAEKDVEKAGPADILWEESGEMIRIYELNENKQTTRSLAYRIPTGRVPSKVIEEVSNMLKKPGIYIVSGVKVRQNRKNGFVYFDGITREGDEKLKPHIGQRADILIEINADGSREITRIAENNVGDENAEAIWELPPQTEDARLEFPRVERFMDFLGLKKDGWFRGLLVGAVEFLPNVIFSAKRFVDMHYNSKGINNPNKYGYIYRERLKGAEAIKKATLNGFSAGSVLGLIMFFAGTSVFAAVMAVAGTTFIFNMARHAYHNVTKSWAKLELGSDESDQLPHSLPHQSFIPMLEDLKRTPSKIDKFFIQGKDYEELQQQIQEYIVQIKSKTDGKFLEYMRTNDGWEKLKKTLVDAGLFKEGDFDNENKDVEITTIDGRPVMLSYVMNVIFDRQFQLQNISNIKVSDNGKYENIVDFYGIIFKKDPGYADRLEVVKDVVDILKNPKLEVEGESIAFVPASLRERQLQTFALAQLGGEAVESERAYAIDTGTIQAYIENALHYVSHDIELVRVTGRKSGIPVRGFLRKKAQLNETIKLMRYENLKKGTVFEVNKNTGIGEIFFYAGPALAYILIDTNKEMYYEGSKVLRAATVSMFDISNVLRAEKAAQVFNTLFLGSGVKNEIEILISKYNSFCESDDYEPAAAENKFNRIKKDMELWNSRREGIKELDSGINDFFEKNKNFLSNFTSASVIEQEVNPGLPLDVESRQASQSVDHRSFMPMLKYFQNNPSAINRLLIPENNLFRQIQIYIDQLVQGRDGKFLWHIQTYSGWEQLKRILVDAGIFAEEDFDDEKKDIEITTIDGRPVMLSYVMNVIFDRQFQLQNTSNIKIHDNGKQKDIVGFYGIIFKKDFGYADRMEVVKNVVYILKNPKLEIEGDNIVFVPAALRERQMQQFALAQLGDETVESERAYAVGTGTIQAYIENALNYISHDFESAASLAASGKKSDFPIRGLAREKMQISETVKLMRDGNFKKDIVFEVNKKAWIGNIFFYVGSKLIHISISQQTYYEGNEALRVSEVVPERKSSQAARIFKILFLDRGVKDEIETLINEYNSFCESDNYEPAEAENKFNRIKKDMKLWNFRREGLKDIDGFFEKNKMFLGDFKTSAPVTGQNAKLDFSETKTGAKTPKSIIMTAVVTAAMFFSLAFSDLTDAAASPLFAHPSYAVAQRRMTDGEIAQLNINNRRDFPALSMKNAADEFLEKLSQTALPESIKRWGFVETIAVKTKTEAEKAIEKNMFNKKLVNGETGIEATVATNQRNKLVSNAAVEKSKENGFTREAHYAAVSVIDKLFKQAVLAETRPDRDKKSGIDSIKRFVSPLKISGQTCYAYITLKETEGHKIYSMELMDKEKLRGMLSDLDSKPTPARSSSLRSIDIINKLDSIVNENDMPKIADMPLNDFTIRTAGLTLDGLKSVVRQIIEDNLIENPVNARGDIIKDDIVVRYYMDDNEAVLTSRSSYANRFGDYKYTDVEVFGMDSSGDNQIKTAVLKASEQAELEKKAYAQQQKLQKSDKSFFGMLKNSGIYMVSGKMPEIADSKLGLPPARRAAGTRGKDVIKRISVYYSFTENEITSEQMNARGIIEKGDEAIVEILMTNKMPSDKIAFKFKNMGVKIEKNEKSVWLGSAENRIIIFAENADLKEIESAVQDNQKVQRELSRLVQKATGKRVDAKSAVRWFNVETDAEAKETSFNYEGGIVRIKLTPEDAQRNQDAIDDFMTGIRDIADADTMAMIENIYYFLDDVKTAEKLYKVLENFQKIGNGQIILSYDAYNAIKKKFRDDKDKIKEFFSAVRASGIKIIADHRDISRNVDSAAKNDYRSAGFDGVLYNKSKEESKESLAIHDFALASETNASVIKEKEYLTEGYLDAEKLISALRETKDIKIFNNSEIVKTIDGGSRSSILDRIGISQLLKPVDARIIGEKNENTVKNSAYNLRRDNFKAFEKIDEQEIARLIKLLRANNVEAVITSLPAVYSVNTYLRDISQKADKAEVAALQKAYLEGIFEKLLVCKTMGETRDIANKTLEKQLGQALRLQLLYGKERVADVNTLMQLLPEKDRVADDGHNTFSDIFRKNEKEKTHGKYPRMKGEVFEKQVAGDLQAALKKTINDLAESAFEKEDNIALSAIIELIPALAKERLNIDVDNNSAAQFDVRELKPLLAAA